MSKGGRCNVPTRATTTSSEHCNWNCAPIAPTILPRPYPAAQSSQKKQFKSKILTSSINYNPTPREARGCRVNGKDVAHYHDSDGEYLHSTKVSPESPRSREHAAGRRR
jgi:hypothetical protein